MPDFAGYTHKWRAVPNNTDANKVSKRNRQPVSCLPCRTRKLKCDRGHPCEACVKRGDEDVCHYGNKPAGATGGGHHQAQSSKAQDRLRHLEDLVRRMINPDALNPRSPASSSDHDDDPATGDGDGDGDGDGTLNRQTHSTDYKGSTHWSAILESVRDLRTTLSVPLSPDSHPDSTTSPHESSGWDSHSYEEHAQRLETTLFGSRPPLPLARLLARYLPPRKQIDRLLSTYFNSQYVPIPFIHTQQFARQYEEFWQDPGAERTSPMWLSSLFSILTMADRIRTAMNTEFGSGIDRHAQRYTTSESHEVSQSSSPDHDAASSNVMARDPIQPNYHTSVGFMAASSQLLTIGDYTKPQPFLVEALMIHSQAKYSLSLDPNRETALVLSLLVRQAYTMSYHRDCSNYPSGQFTPFEAEMRRRTWASIKQFDLMSSFQYGIPMNVAEASWDTKPSRNLMDMDFDEDTKVLPEPRGEVDPTPMLYFVLKTRLMDVYAKILRHTLSFPPTDGSGVNDDVKNTVMNLDAEMRRVSESVPTVMRVRPMNLSYSDPSWLIMLRTNLMFVVQKSLCVLHRKYMTSNNETSFRDVTYSRKVVIEAASNMVNHFLEIHNEFQPGGQLSRDWWMLGGFTVNDFLLANMLLCFAFWTNPKRKAARSHQAPPMGSQHWLETDEVSRGILGLLGRAQVVCLVYGKTSNESRKAAQVLQVILDKFPVGRTQETAVEGDTQDYHLDVAGGTATSTSPGALPQATGTDRERLDLTPLSLHDFDTAQVAVQNLEVSPPKAGTHQTTSHVPDHEHASAAWNIYSAVPYKTTVQEWPEQAARPRGAQPQQQQQRQQQQQPHQRPSYNPPSVHPSQLSPATQTQPSQFPITQAFSSWNITSAEAEAAVIGTSPTQTVEACSDPATEPIDMDWATFDQFLGNFSSSGNFSFSTTPASAPGQWTASGRNRTAPVAPIVPDNEMLVDAPASSDLSHPTQHQ